MADDIEVTDEMVAAGRRVLEAFANRPEDPTEEEGDEFIRDLIRAALEVMPDLEAKGVRFPRH